MVYGKIELLIKDEKNIDKITHDNSTIKYTGDYLLITGIKKSVKHVVVYNLKDIKEMKMV